MRFGVAVPQAGSFLDPATQQRLAAEIEGLGYDSLWVSDHVIVPVGESYIPETMHEPLALLAWLAACTERVTLGVSVLILPYRDPVFTAKFLSSVDVLSGGRLVLGAGVGWMEREFEALSASFAERGAVTDEYLRVIRNLWETETSTFHGQWKHYDDMRMFPKGARTRTGPIPIVVGGNTAPAIRRAAELGDGWHPINLTPDQLEQGVARYRDACDRAGRAPGPVVLRLMPPPPAGPPDAEQVASYEKAGLDELMLSLPIRRPDEHIEALAAFRRDVG